MEGTIKKIIERLLKKSGEKDLDYDKEVERLYKLYEDLRLKKITVEKLDIIDAMILIEVLNEVIELRLGAINGVN